MLLAAARRSPQHRLYPGHQVNRCGGIRTPDVATMITASPLCKSPHMNFRRVLQHPRQPAAVPARFAAAMHARLLPGRSGLPSRSPTLPCAIAAQPPAPRRPSDASQSSRAICGSSLRISESGVVLIVTVFFVIRSFTTKLPALASVDSTIPAMIPERARNDLLRRHFISVRALLAPRRHLIARLNRRQRRGLRIAELHRVRRVPPHKRARRRVDGDRPRSRRKGHRSRRRIHALRNPAHARASASPPLPAAAWLPGRSSYSPPQSKRRRWIARHHHQHPVARR